MVHWEGFFFFSFIDRWQMAFQVIACGSGFISVGGHSISSSGTCLYVDVAAVRSLCAHRQTESGSVAAAIKSRFEQAAVKRQSSFQVPQLLCLQTQVVSFTANSLPGGPDCPFLHSEHVWSSVRG